MNVMVAAARKAGKSLARDFGEVENLQVSVKGPGNFVSAADFRSEKILYEELTRAREGYGFLMEESGTVEGDDKTHRWIIDPLDGTTNFLHGIPIFNISIGLEREGQIVAGVVYNPAMDEMYTAEKGKGAFMNDRRLRVAGRKSMMDCVISTGTPTMNTTVHEAFLGEVRTVMNQVASFRRFGSAALDLCYVASGRSDGFWERNLHAWDMAAGILMIREAGGFVTDLHGGTDMFGTQTVVAGNQFVHRQLIEMVGDKRDET